MTVKFNWGCGTDIRQGYVNVDFRFDLPVISGVALQRVDLSYFPYPWEDEIASEILMLDFLEHFPYRLTDRILMEAWRILKPRGHVDIQVPDFEHCSRAALLIPDFDCNFCGYHFYHQSQFSLEKCVGCGVRLFDIQDAAVKRLYGGQDYEGNFHYTAFTVGLLEHRLRRLGFDKFEELEKEHQIKNWNRKLRAFKSVDPWVEV
jgi:predicted SAM-dependent methyltransferase